MSAVRRDPWLITQSGHVWRQFPSSTFLAKKLNLRTAGERPSWVRYAPTYITNIYPLSKEVNYFPGGSFPA